MQSEPQILEAEVLEIDGNAPAPSPTGQAPRQRSWQDWRAWHGRIRMLDARLWPLWLFLGIIAVTLIVTIGLVLGIIWITLRILAGILRIIISLFNSPRRGVIR